MEVTNNSKLVLLRKDMKELIFSNLNFSDYLNIITTCSQLKDFFKIKPKTLKILKLIKESHLQEIIDNFDVYLDKYEKFYGIKEKDLYEAIGLRIVFTIDTSSNQKELSIKISILKNWVILKNSLDSLQSNIFLRKSSILLILNPQNYKNFLKSKINEMNQFIKGLKFYENSLDEEGLLLLNLFLKENISIRALYIEKNNLTEKACFQLVEIIKNTEVLNNLYLSKININENCTKKIFNELKVKKSVIKLYYANNNVDKGCAEILGEVLSTNNTITTLDLSNNMLHDEGVMILSEAIKNNNTLKSLSLSSNNLTANCVKSLVDMIKVNNSITYLDISENKFNCKAIKQLLKSIQSSKITKLSLAKSEMNRKIFKSFFDNIFNIVDLNLSGNELEPDSCTLLYTFLKEGNSRNLKSLSLNQCNIDNIGLYWIYNGMKKNKSLKTLKLSNNNFTDEGAKNISLFLEKNQSLSELDISYNKITDDGLKLIFASITGRSFLKILNISSNVFTDVTSTVIGEFLFNRSQLKTLIMKTTLIREDYYKYIIDAANLNNYLQKLVIQVRLKNNFAKMRKIEFEI